ncbi:EcsC family protein [Clostridium sp.]|uniref:EcsC family protein n=1 Tax=Clostridium sp. TaxID=1506 RepID=UPI002622C5DC|nr:EcsC family protein [Clostridium sp.]
MRNILEKEIIKIDKKVNKIIGKKESYIKSKLNPISDKIEEVIPEKLKDNLEKAFYNGFKLVIKKGSQYIEKLYDKEKIKIEHDISDYALNRKLNRKALRGIDKQGKRSKIVNTTISTVEGGGLGLLGIGLPDIPIFIGVIIKTVYEIALSYGFDYEKEEELIYILTLISAALTIEEKQIKYNSKLDYLGKKIDLNIKIEDDIDEVIKETSEVLSETLLISKFIQGLPIIGVIGGFTNYKVINKLTTYGNLKYKRRFIENKVV